MKGTRWLGRLDHFDLIARWYDRLIRLPKDGRLGELLAAEPGQLVLDIGGGTGRLVGVLNAAEAYVVVCDASPGMTRQARAKGLRVVLCDVTRLPFPSGIAPRVLVVDAFHHFVVPSPELAQPAAAQELVRALAPAGRLVIEEPDARKLAVKFIVLMEKVLLMGSRFLDPEQLAALLRAAGAAQVVVYPDGASARVVVEGVQV